MSAYVKKIQFKLHESYGNPLRGERSLSCITFYLNLFFASCSLFQYYPSSRYKTTL